MLPKLFKTSLAMYQQATWSGKNESGWDAIGAHVLIQPDECMSRSAGGIEIPDDVADRMTMAAEAGVVVSVGEGAFEEFKGYKPKPGDRVSIGRYSGQLIMGHNNKKYRMLSDTEIAGVNKEVEHASNS